MQIKLKSLSLLNFKGIKEMHTDFSDLTEVFGDNATGKTTLFDAFCWLLFGKDSLDRKDFQVKTLDSQNKAISKLEHSVTGIILHDGKEISLQRIFKEKWVKKQGETKSEFSGHESKFFVNGTPFQAGEFQRFVSDLIPESLFKMVTSPYYFNSMKWQDRRAAIIAMAGSVSDNEVAAGITEFESLLAEGKDLAQYKRELSAKRKMLNDSLKMIPTRIDELHRGLPDKESVDSLGKDSARINVRLLEIDAAIQSENTAFSELNKSITEKQNTVHKLKRELQELEFVEKRKLVTASQQRTNDILAAQSKIRSIEQAIKDLEDDILVQKSRAERKRIEKAELVKKWETKNAEKLTFKDDEFKCPTCSQDLPVASFEDKRKQLTEDFNNKKARDLAAITEEGSQLKRTIDSALNNISDAQKSLTIKQEDLKTANRELSELQNQDAPKESVSIDVVLSKNEKYVQLQSEIKTIESQIVAATEPDLSAYKQEKSQLQSELDSIKQTITIQEQREKTVVRISQLKTEEQDLAQQIADLEKTEFAIDRFNKAKIIAIEEKINGNFKYVTFKMYNELINGGEEETCEALINGVPFSDANHAAQINAGLDIVNAFSRHYNIIAPVFIDNAEAITRLIETPSQLIRLVVSAQDKKLRVVGEKQSVAA